ncbi:MAG: murein biosynthesis integral membrane protein MurJ [Planktomarina sp.]
MNPIRLMRGFVTVGAWTMMSRIFGFARDIMIAAFLGAGPVAEAFFLAFSLPNLFRRFFAEGAFNMAFVPMFSKKLQSGLGAEDFARDAFSGMAFLLTVFSVVAMIAMPWLVWLMASGFVGDARFDLTVLFGRIAFPYILFISLAALASGVLNAAGHFRAAAAAPVLLNVLFISAMVLGGLMGWDIGLTLAWTVPIGGIAQLALVWWAARNAGISLIPKLPCMTPELKRLALIAAPAALAGGVVQINLLIGRNVASYFEGANAWLYYADRLYQLPLGVVGIAIGIVLLPDLSRKLAANDTAGGREAFNRANEIALILTVPCAVALAVISGPLISVLFERGSFTASDTAATALACAIYGLGLPAFVLQKTYQPLFFAREDTTSPFRYALVALVVNAVLAIGLSPFIGYIAAAVGTTLAGWAMLVCLWWGSRSMGDASALDARFKARMPRIVLASLAMGAVLYGVATLGAELLQMQTVRYFALAVLVAIGGISFAIAGQAFGAFKLSEIKSGLRR